MMKAEVVGAVVGLLIIIGLVLFLGIAFTGQYSYDYRCKGIVVEQRLNVLGVPVGGYEAVDGDAAGGCDGR